MRKKRAESPYNLRRVHKKRLTIAVNPCGCYWIRTSDFYPVKENIKYLISLLLNPQHKYTNKFSNKYKGLQVFAKL